MSQWVVIKEGGIHRTRGIIGPFTHEEAWDYVDENELDMRKTNVRSLRDP